MPDGLQMVFSRAGHFHDGIAVETVLQHGAGGFKYSFVAAFCNATLFT
jgi:hypothetical protein